MSNEAITWAYRDVKGIGLTAKAVLVRLADQANSDGVAWPGKNSLAEVLDCDKRTVDRAIEKLIAMGLISVQQAKNATGRNETNVYCLHLKQAELFDQDGAPRVAERRGWQSATHGTAPGGRVAESPKEGGTAPPEPSLNPQLEPKENSSTDVEVLEYRTAKKKILKGEVLIRFERFWAAFDHKHGKAAAADAWLELERYHRGQPLDWLAPVLAGARAEAKAREHSTKAPKMAQGWLNERRWEDQTGAGQGGRSGPLAADLPWHATWNGIVEEANKRGILYFEYSDPPNLITELIRRLEVAGEEIPGNLLRRLERTPKSAAA